MFLIDSHCHLDQLNYNKFNKSIEDMLKKSNENYVKKFLTVSTSISNFYNIKKLFDIYNNIFYSCGVHPLYCQKETKNFEQQLKKSSTNPRVIALGETGLDYHYSLETKKIQQYFFRKHIQIAIQLNKPIIVHTRNAIHDTIRILKEENAEKCGGIIHSFTENDTTAFQFLDLGFYISFSGIITFKNSILLRKTLNKIPLKSLLIETDSPYLSPVPYRGKENQPAYLLDIAKHICLIKKIHLEEFAKIIKNNFYTLFKF
ncbi:YchF/TatD family DNA exonuclease [Buchnera aphidicola (Aphis craccivora)]|uniref:YchF/TatD family DNA exonuclease n=1 Tax=Buchnera aphidicola (Aphis craccivora) TaxID=466616 RepID=A0A4D6XN90_9GAMM|nr:YchF/TatD family DNA exonuclease [Buchnera aphidicola]QCI16597.1 YchF/TatD family DNA exonuclease [Buchnera aphidicola (Aphis craccivora)]QLL40731.1 YchF/TatD family DNA exonuclease [Buchnera aphidicola (Aphis craccivore)]WAI17570.1 MAG: YchF/TatD family DNA exonuclease [Buchnera aphidicola (Aphis craccivora)]